MIANRGEMASILGMSESTLDIRRRGGLPGEKVGNSWRYDTKKVIEWLVRDATKGSATSKRQAVELRIALAEAEIKEFKNAELRGTMLHVDDVTPIVEEQFVVIKSKVNALPSRLAQRLAAEIGGDAAAVLRIMKDEVAETLDEISTAKLRDPDKGKRGFHLDEEEEPEPEPEPEPEAEEEAHPWEEDDL